MDSTAEPFSKIPQTQHLQPAEQLLASGTLWLCSLKTKILVVNQLEFKSRALKYFENRNKQMGKICWKIIILCILESKLITHNFTIATLNSAHSAVWASPTHSHSLRGPGCERTLGEEGICCLLFWAEVVVCTSQLMRWKLKGSASWTVPRSFGSCRVWTFKMSFSLPSLPPILPTVADQSPANCTVIVPGLALQSV